MIPPIERARRYLAKYPPAVSGQGGHNTTFRLASVLLHGFGLSEMEVLALLREWNGGCQPPWSEAELVHKTRSAANTRDTRPRGYMLGHPSTAVSGARLTNGPPAMPPPPPPKPVFSPMVLKRIATKTMGICEVEAFLKERSPEALDSVDSVGVLRCLYPKDSGENVLLFSVMQSQGQMLWRANRSDWVSNANLPAGPDGVWFLPQPVDGAFHPNPRLGNKPSRRSEESVTSWRYAVLESDEAEPDDWLRCLIQLPLRIASICESGGRSIHALVRLDAESKADWDARVGAVKPVLVTLGADPGALSAVRLTRLPQALRGRRVQQLLYLNPAPDGLPILRPSELGAGKARAVQHTEVSA